PLTSWNLDSRHYSLTCFNGGECVHWQLCDCSRYNATGSRCQLVYNTGAERDNICRTWGQYHYETFDGLYYFFSGKSTYVLVRQNELDEQSFSIHVHNDPECKSSPYSCKRSVSLYFSGDGEIRLSSEVTYKGIGIPLPYTTGNLYIQKVAGYVIVRHQYAFSLAWDGASAVYIKMAPDYWGKTHGLCGNNNAILQDELATSYGKLTEDIEEFVESWRENSPQENIFSWDTTFINIPPCLMQTQGFLQRTHTLCSMLLWPPFRECHEFVSPFPFMASCTNDLCMSGADNATWCRALTEYARTCAQAGKPLHEWRAQFNQCVIKCEEHLVYNECIDCCPVSCQQKTHCVDSELPCVDGCYCPDGFIYENRLCVKPAECPCDYHGTIHRTGAVVHEECNNCTCFGGKWICTNLTCPAECSVSGDIHFMTFDGRKYTFQATCQYILAKSLTSGKFAVTLQNAPCGQNQDGACIQSVSFILNQDSKRQVTLTHSGDVLVYDQYKVNLPYIDDSFEIRKLSSVFLQIKSYIGLQILYDPEGLRLYLKVDARWKDDTIGLCGTFNGNTQDDFLSPVGVPESTPQLFGNSWKTSSACTPEYDHSAMDPCDVHLQAAAYATGSCSIIMKELFAPCYSYLSPLPYFEQCRRDTCKCGQICMCSALSHYAHLCRRFGVMIDYRSNVPECALSCEDTKEYSTCVPTCGETCQALSMPETCSDDCIEGCTCPPGMYLNIKTDRCVQQNECPCYFQGIDYPPGENFNFLCAVFLAHDCPDDQIYVNCSNPQTMEFGQERTCENHLLNLTISAHLPCFSGCMCPHSLVKHGDTCFKPDECPCTWKGKEYFPGDKVISSCHTCICHHGSFECTFHPCPSMCTTYGDRHYRTFDGLSFDYIGNCKIYLVKSTSVITFSIIIENVSCFNTGIICRKYIFINIGKSFIIFNDDTGDPSPLSYIDKLQQIYLWKAGFFTLVYFPNEQITVMWDQRTTVHVEAGPQWQGKLTGLCGNFDSKTINEMRTPENFELTNAQEFGSSWAAVECADSADNRHPCILNPLREPFAKKECGILLSDIFESCHPVVDVTWFYSNCLTDTCGCNQGGDCECFCTSVSAYAHQCCQQGVTVDWRTPRLCLLGKGPYKLVSYLDRDIAIAAKLSDGSVFPAKGNGTHSGDAVSFMLTSGLYKPKAHDPDLVSFEALDRPNYFLYLAFNNTLILSKWGRSETFHNRSTFIIHKNTWLSGYSSFESFAVPGAFIHISASSVNVIKYKHSEAFRLSTLFKLIDANLKFVAHSVCEWHYDVCTSPCFKTCRDPLAEHCQTVPKVEGCVPMCPLNMVLDEVTQRCVYFEDCTQFPTKATLPSLPSYLPTEIQTTMSDRTKLNVSQLSIMAANITVTSFPHLFTILSTLKPVVKPVPSETTKTTVALMKEGIETTFMPGTPPSSHFPLYSATTSRPGIFSSKLPGVSATTSRNFTDSKEFLQTGLTREYSQFIQPNITKATTVLYTQYPASSQTIIVPSSSAKVSFEMTAPSESPARISVSHTTSPLYKPPLSLETTRMHVELDSVGVTKSEGTEPDFTKEATAMVFPISLVTKKIEPVLTTEYPFTLPAVADTKKVTYLRATESKKADSTTPSPVLISTAAISKRVTGPGPSSAEGQVTMAATLHPITQKTTSSPESTIKETLDDTGFTLSPFTKLSSQTSPEGMSIPSSFEAVTSFPTQKSKTDITTKLALVSSQTLTSPSILIHLSESTSPLSILEAPEISGASLTDSPEGEFLKPLAPTASTSVVKGTTDKVSILSKHVPLSTVSYSSVFPAFRVTPATPRFTTSAESVPLGISGLTTQRVTKLLAEKTAGIRESLTTTLFSVSSVASDTKSVISEVPGIDGQILATKLLLSPSTTKHSVTSPASLGFTIPTREPKMPTVMEPVTENECIQYICLDGQLIQVNKSQNCPYNAKQPSCGFLGFAVQVNGDKCCPKWQCACRCTLFSDLSLITFDGHHLTLFKEASYVISQTQDETISIYVTDCSNFHTLCLTMLNLTYLSNQIIIDRLNRKIAVNSRHAWPTIRKYGFKIEDTGFMYNIETPANNRIQWFHTSGVMIIEPNATSDLKVMGMCGFCDGNSTNDLMLPNRTVLSTAGASVVFTDSWQVPNTMKYIGEQRTQDTNCSVRDCSPCLNMLLNQTFSTCHPYVSPGSFCDLWVQDTEYIQNPCIALAAYVAMCNKFNICIEWRSSSYCFFPCPEGFSYKACISACDIASTCQNMEPRSQDLDSCLLLTEGCVCVEETVLHRVHSALCIPEEKCACTDSSGVPHALGETWKTSQSGCCMHKCVDNDTIAPVEFNCSVSSDLECQRFGEVALIIPDDQSCCHQKVCTCNQSLCETFIPDCKGLEKLAIYYQHDSCCPNYSCECDPAKCESMEQIPNCRADQTLIAAHVEGTCCVSYICACGICSDQIPECQEGEVLTVDGNTTERCCPAYQCVCETYRCPEFKCVLGMSLVEVWSPEKCCPYRTCEKIILDEQFQNSTENVCHCTKYKCCKDKVCLNNDRGILLPGQSVVEHSPDGVCHTSYCTTIIDPVTKYYRINISTIDCAARCKSYQVYEPPKDVTTCCGKCKNVSCVHAFSNGTVSHFKPGSIWISNCVRYECTNTPVGPVLVTTPISCPPFNETECVKVGGYIVPFLEGCCKTCKEDGKFCKKVTVRMTIRKNDCRSNTPVNIVSCDGKCPSASIYNYNINTYARFCKCCRELGLHRRNVQLYCSGNSTWVSYMIQEPTDCSCQWS
uniref:Otogelin n=1 Tax=Varanus komodoensis TaxID=61221 RepID=A0A8D2JI74_VARKO